MSAPRQAIRFPGESQSYRESRDQLLEAEAELRRNLETVAKLRRGLPLGGLIPEDYSFAEFHEGAEREVKLSQLFADDKDTLIIYSYMFGPKMEQPCTSCTSILDGLDGVFPHVVQRVNMAICAKSPIARVKQFAANRGWRNLHLISSANSTYNQDYHAESPAGDQLPALNVFARRDDGIHHFYSTELLYSPAESGQDGRHVDLIWPLWNLFDLTPEGRGEGWYPQLSY